MHLKQFHSVTEEQKVSKDENSEGMEQIRSLGTITWELQVQTEQNPKTIEKPLVHGKAGFSLRKRKD